MSVSEWQWEKELCEATAATEVGGRGRYLEPESDVTDDIHREGTKQRVHTQLIACDSAVGARGPCVRHSAYTVA